MDMSQDQSASCCGGVTDWLRGEDATDLASRLHAVADATRLQILSIIGRSEAGEVCACDFVDPIGKSQPTISHHLKILAEAGLIEGDKRGRWIWYRLADDGVPDLARRLDGLADPATATV